MKMFACASMRPCRSMKIYIVGETIKIICAPRRGVLVRMINKKGLSLMHPDARSRSAK